MKKALLFTGFLLVIVFANCHCQMQTKRSVTLYPDNTYEATTGFMLKGSLNVPYFHGGDPVYAGFKHNAPGLAAGVAWRAKLGTAVHLHSELFYHANGAKNPVEDNRVFKPHYTTLPVMLSIGGGPLTFEVGAFISYMWQAENFDYFGNGQGGNFDWRVKKWDYYKRMDRGVTGGITFDAKGLQFGAHYRYGLVGVRKRSYNSPKMLGNRTTALDLAIYVPFKTFAE